MRIDQSKDKWFIGVGLFFTFVLLLLGVYFRVSAYNASHVIGQSYNASEIFTTSYPNNAFPNNEGFYFPYAVEIDIINHWLFVADLINDRVSIFNLDSDNNLIDRVADYVIGQSSFEDYNKDNVSVSEMNAPYDLILNEVSSTLFVTDYNNNRILVFDLSGGITNGMDATYVLGQTDFDSNVSGTSSSTMSGPTGLSFDSITNYLYVSDRGNNRIMVFDVSSISNGQSAIYVIGQTNFDTAMSGTSQSKLKTPGALKKDSNSNYLFLSDFGNHRVLVFDTTELSTEGQNAQYVIGQSNFITGSSGITNNKLNFPWGLDIVSTTLFVADGTNNRVLAFDTTELSVSGQNAKYIIGQSDFVSNSYGTTSSTLHNPRGIKYYNNKLFVSDITNNRVSIFDVTEIVDGESAVDLLGQLDDNDDPVFTTKYVNNTSPSASGFDSVLSLLLDDTSHRLFVSDRLQHRILVFDMDENNELLDYTADYVLGQTDFISMTAGTTTSTLNGPRGMAYDSVNDYLFVADFDNNRVLTFDVSTITNGEDAVYVLGQTDFTTLVNGVCNSSTMDTPEGLYYDANSSTLFVAEDHNSRVSIFDLSGGISNGMSATNVLGQPNFDTKTTATTASKMNKPAFIEYDLERGYLFVSEYNNRRVLVFNIGDGIVDGESAINVLGQANFTSGTGGTTQSKILYGRGMSLDTDHNRLFLSDWGNYRTLVYDVTDISDGENAVMVLGQDDYVSKLYSSVTQSGPFHGMNPVYDNSNSRHRLYVPGYISRILIFDFIKVSSGSLTAGVVGDAYSQTITSNSQGTVTSEVVSGSLPPGLTLSGSTISGTPTTFGTYIFTVHATDTLPMGNFWDEEEMTIEVSQNLTDWSYRKKITIDANQVDADLTNFPVLVSFSADTNLATSASSTGADIMFVASGIAWNSGTAGDRYDFEIEKYDSSTGELVAWVKIPELSSSVDTDIYLYYGNDVVAGTLENSTGVWNDNYIMVQHLEEISGTALDDSTSNIEDAVASNINGDSSSSLNTLGKIGSAIKLDGVNDRITVTNTTTVSGLTDAIISGWLYRETTTTYDYFFDKRSASNPAIYLYLSDSTYTSVLKPYSVSQLYVNTVATSTISPCSWQYIVISDLDMSLTTSTLYFGSAFVNSHEFDGWFDELRIYNGNLPSGWSEAEYVNQNNPEDFYSISPEETQNGYALSNWQYRKKITIDADQVAGDLNDFTVLVSFDSDSDLVSHVASSTGGDIIFVPSSEDWTSGNTNNRYSFIISSFDSVSGTLSALVKIPELSSSEDTEFYMYYGNSDATVLQDSDHTEISGSGDDWTTTYSNNRNYPADFYTVSPELVSSGTALSGWNYRKKITVESDYVAGDLTEFPVHINLSSDADLSAKANEDGSDILIVPASFDWTSDDTNDRYQFEIISYTSRTGALETYINIPALSDSIDTEFYIYYNNTSQTTSLEDVNTQNGSSSSTQALSVWTQTVSNNDNEEVNFYSLSDEEFYNQDAYHLTIMGTESMIPGGSQIITISLVDNSSDPALLYDGDKTVVFSGANADTDGNQPTCTNKDSEDINFGSDTVITFTDGVGVCVLKLYKEESVSVDAVAGVFSTIGGSFHDLDIVVSSEQQPTVSGGGGSGVNIRQGGTFKINDGSAIVSSRFITLYMNPGSGVKSMAVANDESFSGVSVGEYKESVDWVLEGEEGFKKVYVKFWYDDGKISGALSISVVLDTKPKIISPAKDEEILQTPFTIEGTANAGNKVEVKIAGTTYTVKADDNGKYSVVVLDQLTFGEYEISARQIDKDGSKGEILTRKIRVGKKIEKVKTEEEKIKEEEKDQVEPIKEYGDVYTIPAGETVDSTSKIEVIDVVIESPTTEKLQAEVQEVSKKDAFLLVMQTDSVGFYKTQIDGIETVGGDLVEILIRPKNELHSVVGRLYSASGGEEKVSWFDRVKKLFVEPAYAENVLDKPEMVDAYLFEFDDQHNVFRTDIVTPKNNGNEYELVISLNGEDGSRVDLSKQVRTAHKGTIKSNQRQVSYARIEILKQNQESGKYEKWDADLYGGKNPLFTEDDGKYALQVPAGAYYLEVAAPGYEIYHSKVYVFSEPSVINDDLEMIEGPYSWWFRFWEWVKRQTQ